MSYYLGLRLTQLEAPGYLYERDLPFRAVEPLVRQVLEELVQRGELDRNATVRAVLTVPKGTSEARDDDQLWDAASATEVGWLRVLKPVEYEAGLPVQSLILYVTAMTRAGVPERTLKLTVPPKLFDGWFQFALSFAASSGVVHENLRREMALCWGDIDQECERFPMLDSEIREIGGEIERYDIHDLPRRPPPRTKREFRVLSTAQEESATVYIKQNVLREIERAAAASTELEIGGLLIGDAYRNNTTDGLFLRIHAHLPARASISERDSMMFSHEDNLRFTEAMQNEYRKCRTLGWYHTHPQAPFMSGPDRKFHETSWQAPWHVALVLGYGGQIKLFFHWTSGRLEPLSSFNIY